MANPELENYITFICPVHGEQMGGTACFLCEFEKLPHQKAIPILKEQGFKCEFTKGLDKLRFSRIPSNILPSVLQVLEFGAVKHNEAPGQENWRQVSHLDHLDAAFRHYAKHCAGEVNDEESGLPHLAHAIVRLMFALETK